MSSNDNAVLPLAVVLGFDITKQKPAEPTPPATPESGLFGLSGGRIRFTPSPYAEGVDWDSIEQGAAPSCLAPVKMPIAHLSIQVAWLHKLVSASHQRARRAAITRSRYKARARKVKLVVVSDEEKEMLRARRAEYARRYRKKMRLERERIRGKSLSIDELRELQEHRRRTALLKKARARKRRREIKRAYLDALLRDAERARAEIKGK